MTTISMTEKEKVMSKVEKLFRLSKSSNPHESALALEKAKTILNNYNLVYFEVEEKENGVKVEDVIIGNRIAEYKKHLLNTIAKFYDCKMIFRCSRGIEINSLRVFGFESDIEFVKISYDYIKSQLDKIYKKKLKEHKATGNILSKKDTMRYKKAFYIQSIMVIDERLKELKQKERYETNKMYDIVVKKDCMIDEFVKKNLGRIKTHRTRVHQNEAGMRDGTEAGRKVNISPKVLNK